MVFLNKNIFFKQFDTFKSAEIGYSIITGLYSGAVNRLIHRCHDLAYFTEFTFSQFIYFGQLGCFSLKKNKIQKARFQMNIPILFSNICLIKCIMIKYLCGTYSYRHNILKKIKFIPILFKLKDINSSL